MSVPPRPPRLAEDVDDNLALWNLDDLTLWIEAHDQAVLEGLDRVKAVATADERVQASWKSPTHTLWFEPRDPRKQGGLGKQTCRTCERQLRDRDGRYLAGPEYVPLQMELEASLKRIAELEKRLAQTAALGGPVKVRVRDPHGPPLVAQIDTGEQFPIEDLAYQVVTIRPEELQRYATLKAFGRERMQRYEQGPNGAYVVIEWMVPIDQYELRPQIFLP